MSLRPMVVLHKLIFLRPISGQCLSNIAMNAIQPSPEKQKAACDSIPNKDGLLVETQGRQSFLVSQMRVMFF